MDEAGTARGSGGMRVAVLSDIGPGTVIEPRHNGVPVRHALITGGSDGVQAPPLFQGPARHGRLLVVDTDQEHIFLCDYGIVLREDGEANESNVSYVVD